MAKPKVCHISSVHQTKDVRIYYKQCQSLAEHYDLTLLIQDSHKKGNHPFKVVALPNFTNRIFRVLVGTWIAFFRTLKQKPDLVHFHDPELLLLAPFFKFFGKKVVFDKHENVKRQILAKEWIGPVFIRRILSKLYAFSEKLCIPFCDKVVIVIPEMAIDFKENKTVLVRNYPISSGFKDSNKISKFNIPTFVYAGDISEERGVREMVEVFQQVEGNCQLILIGRWSSEELKKSCLALDRKERVESKGFLPMNEVYKFLRNSHVGLSLLHPTQNYSKSIPTKVFEYLFADLSVLITDIPYWKDIFGDRAKYVNPFDRKELIKSIEEEIALVNANLNVKFKAWAMEQFSWEAEFHKLHETYIELLEA